MMRIDDPKGNQVRRLVRGQKTLAAASPLGYSSVSGGQTQFIGLLSVLVNGSGVVTGLWKVDGELRVGGTLNGSGTLNWTGPWNLTGAGAITGAVSITNNLTLTGSGQVIVSGGSNDVTLGVSGGLPGLFFQSGARIVNSAGGLLLRAATSSAQILITGSMTTVTGNQHVTGTTTTGGSKLFRMPHPDREGWVIQHGSTESPVSGTEYWGKAKLDANGETVVVLPTYFEGLNKSANRAVIISPIGRPFPVGADEISDGHFTVYGEAGREIHWLVKAERFGGEFEVEVEVEDSLAPGLVVEAGVVQVAAEAGDGDTSDD